MRIPDAAQKQAERARLRARGIVPILLNVPQELVDWIDGIKKANGLKSRDATIQFIADHYRATHRAQEGSTTT